MPKLVTILLLTAALSACVGTTTDKTSNSGDESVAATEAKPEKQKMICSRAKGTGTRLGARVCKPADD